MPPESRAPRALPVDKLTQILAEGLDDEMVVLGSMIQALGRGELPAGLWAQLHEAAQRDDRLLELAAAYDELTKPVMLRRLPAPLTAEVLYQAAEFQREALEDSESALAYLDRAVAADVNHREAFERLEALRIEAGDGARLVELYQTAAGQVSGRDEQRRLLGRALELAEVFGEPVARRVTMAERLLKLDPSDAGARRTLEGLYREAGRWAELARLIEQAPADEDPVGRRARLVELYLGELGLPDRATAQIEELLRLDPASAVGREGARKLLGHKMLGVRTALALEGSLGATGESEAQVEVLGAVVEQMRGPARTDALRRLGRAQIALGRDEDAFVALEKALVVDASDEEARGAFRQVGARLGRPADVARVLQRAAASSKSEALRGRLQLEAGEALLALGDGKRARAALQVASESSDEGVRDEALTRLEQAVGDDARALAEVRERRAALAPEGDARRAALVAVAEAWQSTGDEERTVGAWRRAAEAGAPGAESALEARLEQTGAWAELATRLEATEATRPDAVERAERAAALRAGPLGDAAGALAAWERVIERHGRSPERARARRALLETLGREAALRQALAADAQAASEAGDRAEAASLWGQLARVALAARDTDEALGAVTQALTLVAGEPGAAQVATALLGDRATGLRAARVLLPLYREQADYWGLVRALEEIGARAPGATERLGALAEAIDLVATDDPRRALGLARAGLGEAVSGQPDAIPDWLVRMELLSSAAGDPAAYAGLLLGALGERTVEGPRVDLARRAAEALLEGGESERGLALLERVFTAEPARAREATGADRALGARGDVAARAQLWRLVAAHETEPARRAEALRRLAGFERQRGHEEAALEALRQAGAAAPQDAGQQRELIEALRRAGRPDELSDALAQLASLVEGDERVVVWRELAPLAAGLGQHQRAAEAYGELLEAGTLPASELAAGEAAAVAAPDRVLTERFRQARVAAAVAGDQAQARALGADAALSPQVMTALRAASERGEAPAIASLGAFLEVAPRDEAWRQARRWLLGWRAEHGADRVGALAEWAQAEESELGDVPAAIAVHRRLLEHDPEHVVASDRLLGLLERQGDRVEMRRALQAQRRRTTGERRHKLDLRLATLLADDPASHEETLGLLESLLDAQPRDEAALAVAGQVLDDERAEASVRSAVASLIERGAQGDDPAAVAWLDRLLASGVGDEATRWRWYEARLRPLDGDDEVALQVALRAVDEAPGSVERWEQAELRARRLGRPAPVIDAYRRHLADSSVVATIGQRALDFQEEWGDDPDGTAALLERILMADVGAQWAFDRLKVLYGAEERWSDLLDLFDRLIDAAQSPDERRIFLEDALQIARDFAGDDARAVGYLERLLELRPDDTALQAALDRLSERLVSSFSRPAPGERPADVYLRAARRLKARHEQGERPAELARVLEIELLGTAPSEQPVALRRLIALRLDALGDVNGALDDTLTLLALLPDDEAALRQALTLAATAGAEARLAEALRTQAALVTDDATAATLWLEAARLANGRLGDPARAEQDYRQGLARGRSNGGELGLVAARELSALLTAQRSEPGKRYDALGEQASLETSAGTRRPVLEEMARLARDEMNDPERQAHACRLRLTDAPTDRAALDGLIEACERLGRWDELVDALERRSRLSGSDAGDDLRRAARVRYDRQGDREGALALWTARRQLLGDDDESIDATVALLDETERLDELATLLTAQATRATAPARAASLRARLGATEQRRQRPGPAIEAFAQALRDDPASTDALAGLHALAADEGSRPAALAALLQHYRDRQDSNAVVELLELRLSLAPDATARAEVLRETARLQRDQGDDLTAALATLRRALQATPADLSLLDEVKTTATAAHWPDEALEALREAARDPRASAVARTLWLTVARALTDRDGPGAEEAYEQAMASGDEVELLRPLVELRQRHPDDALPPTLLRLAAVDPAAAPALRTEAGQLVVASSEPLRAQPIARQLLDEARTASADSWPTHLPAIEWALTTLLDPGPAQLPVEPQITVLEGAASLPFAPGRQIELLRRGATLAGESVGTAERAIALWHRLLELAPGDLAALEQLARLHRELGQTEPLRQTLEQQIALDAQPATRTSRRLELAALLQASGQRAEATTVLEAAFAESPTEPEVALRLESLYEASQRPRDLATLLAGQAGRREDAEPAAALPLWLRVATLAEDTLDDLPLAERARQRAAALGDRASRTVLAALLRRRGAHDEAAHQLEQLVDGASGAELSGVRRQLAEAYQAAGRGELARRTLEQALVQAPDPAPLQARLAELYREAGDWARLATLMETEARGLSDDRASAARLREAAELLLTHQDDAARAALLLEEAAGLTPDDVGTLLLLGESLRRAGRIAEAIDVLRRLIEAYGARRPRERAVVHLQLALALRDSQDGAAALAELDVASRIDPAHPRILHAIGQVASAQGETERAQKALRSLLLLLPRSGGRGEHGISRSEVQLSLSDLARRQGDDSRADELVENALAHARDNEGEMPELIEGLRARDLPGPLRRALETNLAAAPPSGRRRALAELASLDERLGQTDASVAWLRQALTEPGDSPSSAELLGSLARLLLPTSLADSLAALEDAIRAGLDAEPAAELFARAVQQHDDSDELLRAYESFGRSSGRSLDLLDALRRQGARPGASTAPLREAAELALSLDAPAADEVLRELAALEAGPDAGPDVRWALLALADRQQARGDLTLAASLRERAAESATSDERRQLRLDVAAMAASSLRDSARAVRLYEAVLDEHPGDPAAWKPLAMLLRQSDDAARLGALLEHLLPVVDADDRTQLRAERIDLLLRDASASGAPPARALELLEDTLADQPDDARAAAQLTTLIEMSGDTARLASHLARQLDLALDRADRDTVVTLALRLGRLHEQRRDERAALDAYRRGLDGAPGNVALLRASLALVEQHDEAPELTELLEGLLASVEGPEAAELALRLASVHEANWNPEGAGQALEQGYAKHPTPALRDQLVERYTDAGEWARLAALHEREASTSSGAARVAALTRAAEVHQRRLQAPAAAADLLQQALALAPTSAPTLRSLLESLDAAPSPTSARRALDALTLALEHRPGDAELRRLRGERHAALGSFDLAIADLDASLATGHQPASASLRSVLQASLAAGGRPEALRPARLRLAALHQDAGDTDAARALLEAAARAEPTQPEVLRALSDHERLAGRLVEAIAPLRTLVAATEGEALVPLAIELTALAISAGRPAEARPGLERARQFAPSRREVREPLLDLYARLGAVREQALLLRDEAAFAPDASRRLEALLGAARLLLDPTHGDARLAAQILDEARQIRPDDLDLAVLQADTLVAQRRTRDALAVLDQVATAHRGRRSRALAQLLQRKAQLELDLGERPVALQTLTRAFENDSTSGQLAMALGRLALELNDETIATRAFRAITLLKTSSEPGATGPDKAQAYYQLSLLALGQDDPRKARMLADKALHEDPSLAQARQLRDELKG